ncbi:FG-GAP-like repeat-containing protein [uncultured Alistipes sp.]|uniref:rhamnogalacturonan lyase family protein n=1 Tax=uncultured Alistipes sp. TaxID=538949 RepID=UPI00267048B4|nr:FG-GAP-like repeat-containing protein [uncultured Alistipes sp.]
MNRLLLTALALWCAALPARAQDPRERVYNYEILKPSHAAKPPVEGFAAQRIREHLGRSLTARPAPDGKSVHLSWRLLETDPPETGFDIYRTAGGKTLRLNRRPITATTDFTDPKPAAKALYRVVPRNSREQRPAPGETEVDLTALPADKPYTAIPITGRVGKLGVGDLDGDGEYDFVVRTPDTNVDPGVQGCHYDSIYTIAAYRRDGKKLWSYSLGEGVEPGVWYSPFAVYDFDGDGRAEVALRICPDGKRDERHRVSSGTEYLVVLDGMTGREIARAPWIERTPRLGDLNRQNRHQIGMAYVDGRTPAIIVARGTYRAMLAEAWQLHDGRLTRLWRWDGDEENPVVRSQGAHNMVAGDVDGDGRDEILLGGCMLDDNGTLLWSAGIGHPDKICMTDIDPSREGMEVLLCGEISNDAGRGVCCVDAATGEQVWNIGIPTTHVGDGMTADIDPTHPGLECFAREDRKAGSQSCYLTTARGERLENRPVPGCRNWVWWDGDLLRETITGTKIVKWPDETVAEGIEGAILLIADLTGDWREEIVTTVDGELRIYGSGLPARDRRTTLMQDPVYRSYVTERSQGYPQSPVPSYYLGEK